MAHIFVGNMPMVNLDILNAFADFDDSYWVFAEFTVGTGPRARQVDWLIVREVPDDRPFGVYSTLIVGELKETTAVFTGLENNVWTEQRNSVESPLVMGNRLDINPLYQAINIGNAVKDWLWNLERVFLDPDHPPTTASDFNVWPTLVILSPPEVQHRLPRRLAFGAIWYGIEGWLGAIKGWVPRRGLQLTRSELERLARAIADSSGVAPWEAPRSLMVDPASEIATTTSTGTGVGATAAETTGSVGVGTLTVRPELDEDATGAEDEYLDDGQPGATGSVGTGWLLELAAWVNETERRLEKLERTLPRTPSPQKPPMPSTRADERFTAEERQMVETALRRVRDRNGKPDFPSVFSELRQLNHGESLKNANFLGWGSSRTMMDQAVAEGWLRYGQEDRNGLPTLYLTEPTRPWGTN